MRIQKMAYKRMKLEDDIKRLKLKGYSNRDIAKELGITENRVIDILEESLKASKLHLNKHNEEAHKAGLPGFEPAKIASDFSSLQKVGEAVKKYQKTQQ